jgi:cytochrome c553
MKSRIATCSVGLAAVLLAALAMGAQTNELREASKLKPDLKHGGALFDTCAACHQPDGAGVADGDIPGIAGQHSQVILKELTDFRDSERIDMRMNAFAARHRLEGPQDLADVAAYISSLPPSWTKQYGSGKYAAVGGQLYTRACAHCHGPSGEGNNELRYPRLAGQHYGYLVKQIDMMIGGARFNVSWDHSKLLESLTDEEITGVADHLARLKPVTAP